MTYRRSSTAFGSSSARPSPPQFSTHTLDQADTSFTYMPVPLQGRVAISISDAATILGVGRTTLYRMLKTAELQTIRIGRRNLVLTSSLARVVKEASNGK